MNELCISYVQKMTLDEKSVSAFREHMRHITKKGKMDEREDTCISICL